MGKSRSKRIRINRNVVLKDSQVYIQSLEDKTIECGFYLLDLDYVEIIKE